MDDEYLYLDRRFAMVAVAISLGFIAVGAAFIGGAEHGIALSFVICGGIFLVMSLALFWLKVAELRDDHVKIGKHRFAYAQIAEIDHGSRIVQDQAALASGTSSRQQDFITVYLRDRDQPVDVSVILYRQGPEGIAAKIMERVNLLNTG
ncbi:hypothetical protein [Pararhodobacter oceanensis]|uniref:hypothetical protein n=1 Tax=Pararhodobacter oceanensis TaxID=2172121 RepID=UPI003A8DD97F